VAGLVRAMAGAGQSLTVVLPEARSLDGGRKYLRDFHGLSLQLHVIPDAAISWALRNTDVVLVGCETLTLEGGCYNTIGTEFAARVAAQEGVPVHVVSILLKTDLANITEGNRAVRLLDFSHYLSWTGWRKELMRSSFSFPDLDYTPPYLLTSLIAERGVLDPGEVGRAALETLSGGTPHRD